MVHRVGFSYVLYLEKFPVYKSTENYRDYTSTIETGPTL